MHFDFTQFLSAVFIFLGSYFGTKHGNSGGN